MSGTYSVQLPDASAVSLTASAWVSGYTNATDAFPMPASNLAKNYALAADLTACAAPGYAVTQGTVFFAESFESATPPGLPSGWSVTDVSGTLGDWLSATVSRPPLRMGSPWRVQPRLLQCLLRQRREQHERAQP